MGLRKYLWRFVWLVLPAMALACHLSAQSSVSKIADIQLQIFASRVNPDSVLCGRGHILIDGSFQIDSLPRVIGGPPCLGNVIIGQFPFGATEEEVEGQKAAFDQILDHNPNLEIVCGVLMPSNGTALCRRRRLRGRYAQ